MNMRAGSGSSHSTPEGHKRYVRTTQVVDERFALRAVWMKGNIHRIPVIESHTIMRRRLAESAHGQIMTEGLVEISFDILRLLKRPKITLTIGRHSARVSEPVKARDGYGR